MIGATILPFPAAGATASRRVPASLFGSPTGAGFEDAMDGALGAASWRADEAARRNAAGPDRRPAQEAGASRSRAAENARVDRPGHGPAGARDTSAAGRADDTSRRSGAAGERRSRNDDAESSVDGGDDNAPQDGIAQSGQATEASVVKAKDDGQTAAGESPASGVPAEAGTGAPAEGAAAASTGFAASTTGTSAAKAETDGPAQRARILRWPTAKAAGSDSGTAPGATATTAPKAEAADAGAGPPRAHAPASTAAVSQPGAAAAAVAALATSAGAPNVTDTGAAATQSPAKTTATLAAVESATPALETAAPQPERPSAVDTLARAETTAVAASLAAVEPALNGGTAEAGSHDQGQRHAPAAHANEPSPTVTGPVTGPVQFAVNVPASAAAYTGATAGQEEGLLPQIVQSIRVHALQGASEARVQLKPEHLGALNLTLKVEHGQVTATIQADVEAVRQWIESHEQSLRQALSEQGLQLARLVVLPDGESAGDGRDPNQPRRQPRRRSWRDEDVTFEVLV